MAHRIIILGASGYTGAELVRLIALHPQMEIVALSADRKAGLEMRDVFPHLSHLSLPVLKKIDDIYDLISSSKMRQSKPPYRWSLSLQLVQTPTC